MKPEPQRQVSLTAKEQLKQAARLREENIANSTAELSQKAIKVTDTHTRVEDELKSRKAKQAEKQLARNENRERLAKLQAEADAKTAAEADDFKSLTEFLSVSNTEDEAVSYTATVKGSPDNIRTTNEEGNQTGDQTQQEEDEEEGEGGEEEADGDEVSDSHPDDGEEEEEDGDEEEDEDDDDYKELSDDDSQVPSDSDEPTPTVPKKQKPMPIKALAKRRSPRTKPEVEPQPKPAKPAKVKTSAAKPKVADKPLRKRKAEEADIEQPPRQQHMTTSLINMKEAFYLTRGVLLADMDGSARLFYQQAHRPGFNAGYKSLIEADALDTIRDSLLQNMKLTGYTPTQSVGWPVLTTGTLTLKQMAEDL